ncbi:MAG: GIY-YIG nuclease family protein [Clostridia bacterium]|nr:GIY-YIG nuclease family protein [Clostridia bacterium]
MAHYVYLLRCRDDTLYCGYTTDVERRVKTHNEGKGAKYTKTRLPVEVVYIEECIDKSDALKRECAIKRLSREQKLALLSEK